MLKKGRSEPWIDVLAEFLDEDTGRINATGFMEYFQLLDEYLEDYITKNSIPVSINNDDGSKLKRFL